jgi:hypothetical protein
MMDRAEAALIDDDGETCETLSPEEIAEEIERLIYLRAAAAVEQLELADPRDRWRHIAGGQPPRKIEPAPAAARQYRTAQSTIAAFFYVASLNDPDHLKRWLAQHPADAPFLLKLLERK